MTNSSRQILNSVAEQAARLKARLAETHDAIRRGCADGGEAGADVPAEDASEGDDAGRSNVLAFVRR